MCVGFQKREWCADHPIMTGCVYLWFWAVLSAIRCKG